MGKFTKDKRVLKDFLYSKNDIYYRKAKVDQFRARSAYKLLQINEFFNVFKNVTRAIDLCAAPGSWSQVLSKQLSQNNLFQQQTNENRIVAVDLQEMAPIDHVCQIQGDITKKATVDAILQKFGGHLSDIIVSDGAPDVTGFHDIDQYMQSQLIVAALNICLMTLKEDGIFIAKIFKGSDIKQLYSQFKVFFKQVYFHKPKSSRASSVENFIICLSFDPPFSIVNFHLYTFEKEIRSAEKEKEICAIKEKEQVEKEQKEREEREKEKYWKFITSGDLSGFDE